MHATVSLQKLPLLRELLSPSCCHEKKRPLNTEINSIIRENVVLIVIICFIVKRMKKNPGLCVFGKALDTFILLHISSLSAEDTAKACRHTDPSMHLNSLQQSTYLSCITRKNEAEGERGRVKKNVT